MAIQTSFAEQADTIPVHLVDAAELRGEAVRDMAVVQDDLPGMLMRYVVAYPPLKEAAALAVTAVTSGRLSTESGYTRVVIDSMIYTADEEILDNASAILQEMGQDSRIIKDLPEEATETDFLVWRNHIQQKETD